jgi:hypothetical protein
MKYSSINDAFRPLVDVRPMDQLQSKKENVVYQQQKQENKVIEQQVQIPQQQPIVKQQEVQQKYVVPYTPPVPIQPMIQSRNENYVIEGFSGVQPVIQNMNKREYAPTYHPTMFNPNDYYARKHSKFEDDLETISDISELSFDKKKCKKYLRHIKQCPYCQSKLKMHNKSKNDVFVFLAMGVLIIFIMDTFVRLGKKL